MYISRKAYLAAGAAAAALFAATGALAQVRSFNIPAEPAAKAIPEFAAQAGIQIGAPASELDGVQTQAIQGNFDARDALKRLLAGTNLEIAADTGSVISLRARRAATLPTDPGAKPATAAGPGNPASARDPDPTAAEVVVTGIRKAYADAVSAKKQDLEISDGISADGLDKLPDLNLGEALQRLPGVQISRTEEGRDATLSIRGLPGEYALPTINGVIYALPLVLSSNPFGAYPSDIFNSARIEKTPMADVQSGAIAGRVDMQIGALAAKDTTRLKASYEYNELGKLGAPGFSARFNHHFSDRLAASLNVAYQKQNFRRDEILYTAYNTLSATNTPNFASLYSDYYAPTCAGSTARFCSAAPTGTGKTATTGILYLSVPREYTRVNKGKTLAFSGGLEYQVTDDLKLSLNGFHSDKDLNGTHQYYAVATANGAGTTILPQSAPVKLADGRWIVHDVKVLNPDVWMSTREYYTKAKSQGLFANLDYAHGPLTINAIGSKSDSSAYFLEQQYDFETLNYANTPLGGAGNGIVGEWHDGAGSIDDFVYHLTPPPGQTSLVYAQPAASSTWNWNASIDPTVLLDGTTAANSQRRLRFTGSPSWGQQHVSTGKVHAEYALADAFSVAGGAEITHVEYDSQAVRTSAYGLQTQNLTQSMIVPSPFMGSFFGGKLGANGLSTWTISDNSFLSAIQPVTPYPGGALSSLGYNIYYNTGQYAQYNFTYGTNTDAGFIQAKYKASIFGIPVRGNFGLRYEKLTSTTDALTRVSASGPLGSPSDFKYTKFKSKHSYTLPSAILAADLTDRLVLRLAGYKSYAAPLIRQNTPVSIIGTPSLDAAGNTSVSLTYGNPNIHPYTSFSKDVSLEWYNRRGSVISFAYYQKTIKGFIAPIVDKSLICPADATQYGLGTLTWDSATGTCQSSLAAPGTKFYVNATGNMNYDQPIHVRGYEFNVQQNFDWLPKPFNNLGTVFNYTHTKAAGRINGTTVTLNNVSPESLNWVMYYETRKWGVRATYSWRAAYAPSTFYQPVNNIMVAARDQWDVSATYNLTPRISVQVSGFNLTNNEVYRYTNQPEMPAYHDLDGRTFTVALKASF
jgi:TonB-dependent receptor